ncbi:MAG: hypothetical protein E7173_02770 [Firmicutes bacterium]|nr:hypothetical protein [Bacillota bacterium]
MNIYLVQLITNWVGILCLVVLSLFGTNIKENSIIINNNTVHNTDSVLSMVTEYKTIKKYNNKLPQGTINVLVEGIDGISYVDSNGTEQQLRPVVNEVLEIGTGAGANYVGNTTGYGADCEGCSGTVACRTREGKNHHLVNDGVYYKDIQYGDVRILAASHKVFGCGTIIEVDNGRGEPFLGIVLDTGIDMRKNWELYGLIHLDIAFETQKDPAVYSVTSTGSRAKFEVKRWGW